MNQVKTHHSFHKDSRGEVVIIDGKVYELVPSETWSLPKLKATSPKDRPHCRMLTMITEHTAAEEAKRTADQVQLFEFAKVVRPNKKTFNVKELVEEGGDIGEKIKELLQKKAKASGAEKKLIRKQLRKLDYKRYLKKGEDDDSAGDSE